MVQTRREWLQAAAGLGALGGCHAGAPWFRALAAADQRPREHRACILLWMNGGPSQFETLDPKPGAANGGPTKAIATVTPGIQISELLPKVAECSDKIAFVRSMSTKEGDHQRATFVGHTGRAPQGPIAYPALGSLAAKALGGEEDLPAFVSINSQPFFGAPQPSGFLGPQYAPLRVGGMAAAASPNARNTQLAVANLRNAVPDDRFNARWKLLQAQQGEFAAARPSQAVESHRAAVHKAERMMRGRALAAFDLSAESKSAAAAYGDSAFGRSCLLARRLVEFGVTFVEVSFPGWDTHANNFEQSKTLCGPLDEGWSALVKDLAQRGLLESTIVVWMGEFGRTPLINASRGRDHYPRAWSAAMAGGGPGGLVVGETSKDGVVVEDAPVSSAEWIATICSRLKMDITQQNMSNVGRPIRVVDPGVRPVEALL